MALATVVTTFNVHDLFGGDFDARRVKAWATTNAPAGTIHDTSTGESRIGGAYATIAADGTGSFSHWAPGADGNPATWQTTYHFDVPDASTTKGRRVETYGPFTVTASGEMTALVTEQVAVPTATASDYAAAAGVSATSAAASETSAAASATAAAASETAAEAARDAAVDISGISTSDGVVSTLVEGTAGAGPLTRAALSATIAAATPDGTQGVKGLVRYATTAQAVTGTATDRAYSPGVLLAADADATSALRVQQDARIEGSITSAVEGKAAKDALVVDVTDHGAIGDGATNDTAAILTAVTVVAAAGGGTLYFPAGRYLARLLRINASNITLRGARGATLVYDATGSAASDGLLCWGDQSSVGGITTASNFKNIVVENLAFEGVGSTLGLNENQGLIKAAGVSDMAIRGCTFTDFQGDGVTIFCTTTSATERHNERVTVEDCTFDGVGNYGRQGVSIIEGSSVAITRCRFVNCAAPTMPGAVDVEPNALNTWSIIRDISVTNCLFDGCGGNVADVVVALNPATFATVPSGLRFEGNHHVNSKVGCYYVSWSGHAATSASTAMGIVIRGNFTKGSGANSAAWATIAGVRGVAVKGNTVVDWPSYMGIIGAASTVSVDAIEYDGNTFLNCGVNVGPILFATFHTNLSFTRNRVTRATASISALITLAAGGTSSGVKVLENDCTGATVSNLAVLGAGHTTTTAGNRARGNINTPAPLATIFTGAPSVTGSRAGNAALASLLTTLAAAGYIQDGSTA